MRDRKASRNYSPERDEFRRLHEMHRAWGLKRRYAEKQRRLKGAVSGAGPAVGDPGPVLVAGGPAPAAGGSVLVAGGPAPAASGPAIAASSPAGVGPAAGATDRPIRPPSADEVAEGVRPADATTVADAPESSPAEPSTVTRPSSAGESKPSRAAAAARVTTRPVSPIAKDAPAGSLSLSGSSAATAEPTRSARPGKWRPPIERNSPTDHDARPAPSSRRRPIATARISMAALGWCGCFRRDASTRQRNPIRQTDPAPPSNARRARRFDLAELRAISVRRGRDCRLRGWRTPGAIVASRPDGVGVAGLLRRDHGAGPGGATGRSRESAGVGHGDRRGPDRGVARRGPRAFGSRPGEWAAGGRRAPPRELRWPGHGLVRGRSVEVGATAWCGAGRWRWGQRSGAAGHPWWRSCGLVVAPRVVAGNAGAGDGATPVVAGKSACWRAVAGGRDPPHGGRNAMWWRIYPDGAGITRMARDYPGGAGLPGWRGITRVARDYPGGAGLPGWRGISRVAVDDVWVAIP
jgi:hypothetical protein